MKLKACHGIKNTLTHIHVIIFSINTYINVFVFQYLHNRDYILSHCHDLRNTFHLACRHILT